jgi:hypothetical protein
MLKPPDERVMPLTHTNRLKLSEMSVRTDSELTEYSLIDRDGNTYTHDDLNATLSEPDSATVDDLLSTIEASTVKPRRVALAQLTEVVATTPGEYTSVVELIVELLTGTAPAVQGEALGILSRIGETDPEATRLAIERAIELLNESVHPLLRNEALQFLVVFAEHDPTTVTTAVPRLAALLQNESTDTEAVARILAMISRADADALIDVVPKLELFLETEPGRAHTWVLAAIGHLSKTHANIATEVVPIAGELLDTDATPLRANAAGVLADLAEEYPGEVQPWVPDVIELMDDSDEQVRHNATSILARVADDYPETVSPATEQLLAVLDDELADTRFNACWALKYINATGAVERIREIAATDPDGDVRSVAQLALDSIER